MNAAQANTRRRDSDDKAAQILIQETKAAAFDDALKVAKDAPATARRVKALEAENAALKAQADRPVAVTVQQPRPATVKGTVKRPRSTDIAFAKATAHFAQRGIEQVAEDLFPGEPGKLQRKAATAPASTVDAGFGAELVNNDVGPWVEELRPVSVYAAMAAGGVPLPMNEVANLTMPTNPGIGDISGSFVGEKGTIPVKSGVVGSVSFHRMKMAVLSVFTNELRDTSTPSIEAVIRRNVVADTSEMLDAYFLNPANAAVPGIRPASPWNGAANQASAGTGLDNVIADIAYLTGVITATRPRNPVLIMDNMRAQRLRMMREAGVFLFRDEVERGELFGLPLIISATVPQDHLFVIDLADFASFLPAPEIDTSGSATVALADDDGVAPTMVDTNAVNDQGGSIHISDAAGTVPATKVVSSFQVNATVLRMVQPIAHGMLRTGTAAYVTGVAW
ncbi:MULTISPECIES: phage major capsid protein [unclassified Ruegeria]|uniref:phage major capsid protein n=1 Tax=unclassified Ruegeria TaxID=2625375 RepID=UPI001492327E|nr:MULTISPECIES: phage major capsid protein [unclassified Ruegeria]NOD87418.1 phage major capsid protein [Ruegeria sp. HKCCD4318]NOE12973.1 phage major capsid protein [Ruegeria sp. HKCCD4318-2]NOG08860.1 phage major capsid protein [Ruegeria sp. HKCCD4315]